MAIHGPGKPEAAMHRWPILALACLALWGCQTAGDLSDAPCPANTLCGDTDSDTDSEAFGPPRQPLVRRAAFEIWPGCPTTIQVMAQPRRMVFQAVHPDDQLEPDNDPSDSVCEGPEPSLMRAGRRPDQNLAAR
jgi:hypothetical protein